MNRFGQRKSWVVLVAILLLFAACKGETPTAPPPGGGPTPPGGTPPPSGVNIALTVSNPTPLVDSTVTITATVTNNGQPVPNGTAVEFTASGGALDGGGQATIKTTTNGVATVTLTSSATGPVRVFATVNNVTRQTDVTFQARPITPPPPNTAPTIISVTPPIGRPQGGEVIRITGTNFRAPVRVLFNTGGPLPVEGSVQSVTDTVIEVVTPPVNLGVGQQIVADVIVLTQAGTASEQRVEASDAFTYRAERLTPNVGTVTPNSGPVTGGTRVTIIGDGFQEPVQVLFNTAEARVLNVTFDRILVETPAARDTDPDGSGTVTGPVTVTVRNINSQTEDSMDSAFHYKAAMQITAISPGEGPFTGGTRVDIEGIGFVSPVAVTIGGVPAQPTFVSGTKITAITSGLAIAACADSPGAVTVTNIVNGDTATGPSFTFRVPRPVIMNVRPAVAGDTTITAGEGIIVTVANAQPGANRFTIGTRTLFPTGTTFNSNGTADFTVTLPTNFQFQTEVCTIGGVAGVRRLPLTVSVTYTNAQTTCTDTATDALTINPCDPMPCPCDPPPPPEVTLVTPTPPSPPNCANAGNVAAADPATGTTTVTFRNEGGQPLVINFNSVSGTNPGDFTVSPAASTIAPGQVGSFTVTFNPSAIGTRGATINFNTNDADEGTVSVCVTGNGT